MSCFVFATVNWDYTVLADEEMVPSPGPRNSHMDKGIEPSLLSSWGN